MRHQLTLLIAGEYARAKY